jgi:TATA-binding protein-associated factor
VRLAVVKTLTSFMVVPTLPRDWIAAPFLRLLFQNLIAEERTDVRDASLAAWRMALTVLAGTSGWLDTVVTQQLVLEWYAIMMTPLGVAIDASVFYRPSMEMAGNTVAERHNVDKNMLAQDQALITNEVTLKARVAAATALAQLILFWPSNVRTTISVVICFSQYFRLSPSRTFSSPSYCTISIRRVCYRSS